MGIVCSATSTAEHCFVTLILSHRFPALDAPDLDTLVSGASCPWCSREWDIADEAAWIKFLSLIPSNEADALSLVKELSLLQMAGSAYTAALAGA